MHCNAPGQSFGARGSCRFMREDQVDTVIDPRITRGALERLS